MSDHMLADGVYRTDTDEVKLLDGKWQKADEVMTVLIANESKLSSITGAAPGSMAYTAGFKHMWQLDTDGTTWVPIV